MKKEISKLMTLAALVAVVVIGGSAAAWAAEVPPPCPSSPSYSPDFSSNQGCIAVNGSAGFVGTGDATNILQLTSATYTETGSAWYATPQAVESGFSTSFTFQLTNPSNPPADGFAFLIQNSTAGTGALVAEPVGGCSLGFAGDPTYGVCGPKTGGGITNSVAIAFKTYNNGSNYPNANSVSIQNPGGTGVNCMDRQALGVYACTIAENDLADSTNLADGNVHSVTITFTPSTLTNCGPNQNQTCSLLDVFLDGNDLFHGGVYFDMSTIGLSPDNTALVGFTGATGASYENHNILSWVFTPQGQSQSGMVTQGQTTTFSFNGGFTEGGSNSGFDFTALETDTNLNLQMVVTTIPMSQSACNALVQVSYPGAQCFVYQNGGGQGSDMAVMFAVTCPSAGTCGSSGNAFDANLSSDFNFVCTSTENSPLVCPTFDMNGDETNPGSFGYPNITSSDSLPEIGFLKGEGPDPSNPCTPYSNSQPLFQSNQIISSTIGDSSQKPIKSGSGGTGSCWVPTYLTGNSEIPTIVITSPAQNSSFVQGSNQLVNYTCTSVNNGSASTGPYLTVASCNGDTSQSSQSTVMDSATLPTNTLGQNTYTAYVQDSAYNTSTATLTYYVDAAPAFTSGNATTFTAGMAGSFSVTASGYPTPTFTESGALPTGVTFSNGVLSGTPAAGTGGNYNITFTASNGVSPNAMQNFTLTVDQAPVITSANSTVFTVGVGGSFAVTASAFPASVTFTETGALPMGVSLSSSGLLSGIPAQGSEGAYTVTITATNGVSPNGMQSFTLNVAQASTMTTVTSSLNPSNYGQSVSFTATVAPQVSGTPTGTVSFYNATSGANCAALGSSTLLGTGTLSSGTTAIDTGSLPAGSDTILACYSGDANFYSTALNGTSTTIIETVGAAPVVSLSPSGLTFGNQQVKTSSAPIVVTLTNIGDANLTGLNIQITGSDPGDFSKTTNCSSSLGYTAPNNYCTINVTFTPTDTGIRTASLQFTDNANDSPEFVSLTGAGVSTLSANFNGNPIAGGSYIWFTSVGTLKGLGSNTVNLYITDSTISFTANGTNYSIPVPNAVITFQPNGKSTYTSFDSTNNRWVTVEPNSGLFGNTFLDALSWQVPAGGLPGNIKNVTWTAAYSTDTPGISLTWFWGGAVYSSQFTKSYSGLTSCNTSATPLCVKPTDDSRASQYQNWDPAGTPENVTPYYKQRFMWGTIGTIGWGFTGGFSGTAGVVPTVAPASVSPSQLTFATQSVGTSSGTMTAVLTNNDSVSLTGITIPAVSDDFSQTNNCGSSLAAGASCTITVTFTPTDIGTRTGQFNISNSAKNSPQILYLTGTGQ